MQRRLVILAALCALLAAAPQRAVAATRYPIVLAHGLLASGGPLFSFNRLARFLRWRGYDVYVTEVAAVGTVATRGAQLARQIEAIRRETGAAKVNIVAHSMGGLDARYAISTLGEAAHVASLSTVSTPHHGTSYADEAADGLGEQERLRRLINLLSWFYNRDSRLGRDDALAAIEDLTPAVVERFNAANPDAGGVYYQSWGATASPDGPGAIVRPILADPWAVIAAHEGANDGLVSVDSARWGRYRGTVEADHMGTMGLLRPQRGGDHDPEGFLLGIARELEAWGL